MKRTIKILVVPFLVLCISMSVIGCSQNKTTVIDNNSQTLSENGNETQEETSSTSSNATENRNNKKSDQNQQEEISDTNSNKNNSKNPNSTSNRNNKKSDQNQITDSTQSNTNSTVKTQYGNMEFIYTEDTSIELNYLLYAPDGTTNEKLPLIIYLHGGSGKGNDLSKLTGADSLPKYIKDGSLGDVSAYVLAPQCPANFNSWIEVSNQVFGLIDKVSKEYNIDENKIILTGHSMGGSGTWYIALQQPERFSCIVPMSGRIEDTQENRAALSKTPIWAFVGENDAIVDPAYSVNFYEQLINTNPNIKCTVFESAEHKDVPSLAWLDKEVNLLEWMLAQ